MNFRLIQLQKIIQIIFILPGRTNTTSTTGHHKDKIDSDDEVIEIESDENPPKKKNVTRNTGMY